MMNDAGQRIRELMAEVAELRQENASLRAQLGGNAGRTVDGDFEAFKQGRAKARARAADPDWTAYVQSKQPLKPYTGPPPSMEELKRRMQQRLQQQAVAPAPPTLAPAPEGTA